MKKKGIKEKYIKGVFYRKKLYSIEEKGNKRYKLWCKIYYLILRIGKMREGN